MKDLQYEAQLANCFKTNITECPRGIDPSIFELVEENKEKRREQIRRNIEEYKLKKIHGKKVEISWEQTPEEKRKQKTIERLQAKLQAKRIVAD